MSKPGYRSQRLRSGRRKSSGKGSPGLIGSIARAWRLGTQSNDALESLTRAYEDGRRLDEILATAATRTDTDIDDKAAQAIKDRVGEVRNTLFNVHALLLGLADTVADLHDAVAEVEERPLKDVVEGDQSISE